MMIEHQETGVTATFARTVVRCALLPLALFPLVSCGGPPPPEGAVPVTAGTPMPAPDQTRYRLKPGDVVDVKFYYHPNLNENLVLPPDGMISLQLVGEVTASGLTAGELAAHIEELLAEYLPNPATVVILREFAEQLAFVGGEVARPGPVEMTGGLGLAQAVLINGGPSPGAHTEQVLVIRHGERPTVYLLDLKGILRGEANDFPLEAYDVVFLPPTRITQVGRWVEQNVNAIVPRTLSFPVFIFDRGVSIF